jgi:hypothetical protein
VADLNVLRVKTRKLADRYSIENAGSAKSRVTTYIRRHIVSIVGL